MSECLHTRYRCQKYKGHLWQEAWLSLRDRHWLKEKSTISNALELSPSWHVVINRYADSEQTAFLKMQTRSVCFRKSKCLHFLMRASISTNSIQCCSALALNPWQYLVNYKAFSFHVCIRQICGGVLCIRGQSTHSLFIFNPNDCGTSCTQTMYTFPKRKTQIIGLSRRPTMSLSTKKIYILF